jgi:creatinine amidohydrolase
METTKIFQYSDLTWPEVAAVRRDTPLVIPLGEGYPGEQLSSMLGNPPQIGLLPPLPYGWRGSALSVPDACLGVLLDNLMDSLRDDGFTRVYVLTPPGIELGSGSQAVRASHLRLRTTPSHPSPPAPGNTVPVSSRENTRSVPMMLPPDSERDKVVLICTGHTEQHAYHLPLSTDTLIIDAICQGTAAAIAKQAVALPAFPYGVSTHRSSFAGTTSCGGRAYEDFWLAVIETLVLRGFNRFFFMNGHGGNTSFLHNVVKYAGERHQHIFCATAFLYLSAPQGVAALEQHRQSKIGGMGHACELETSFILHLRPDLVHMERVVDETDFIATPSYYMDWTEGGALTANPPWDDDTATGAYGAGSLGTAEKGELWLAAAIAEKVALVNEIHEQYRLRMQRRNTPGVFPGGHRDGVARSRKVKNSSL